MRHPVPLEEAAIRAINNNPAALDTYLWLAYRLHSPYQPEAGHLEGAEGPVRPGFKELHHFKTQMARHAELALAVYPAADVEW